jgi:hypothetical protein
MQASISCDSESVRSRASPSLTTLGSCTVNPNLIAERLAPSTGSLACYLRLPIPPPHHPSPPFTTPVLHPTFTTASTHTVAAVTHNYGRPDFRHDRPDPGCRI